MWIVLCLNRRNGDDDGAGAEVRKEFLYALPSTTCSCGREASEATGDALHPTTTEDDVFRFREDHARCQGARL